MPRSLMRDRPEGYERVTNVELFFDLVYVFAVTGATFAGLLGPLSLPHADRTPTIAAFVIAFVSSVALWWLYFD